MYLEFVNDKAPDNAEGRTEGPARRVVKRYSNRKLYDTKDSRYVTLLQIAEMVRGGEEVQIIDNNTKEDLTEVTLAQIIYEEQKQKASRAAAAPLRQLRRQQLSPFRLSRFPRLPSECSSVKTATASWSPCELNGRVPATVGL